MKCAFIVTVHFDSLEIVKKNLKQRTRGFDEWWHGTPPPRIQRLAPQISLGPFTRNICALHITNCSVCLPCQSSSYRNRKHKKTFMCRKLVEILFEDGTQRLITNFNQRQIHYKLNPIRFSIRMENWKEIIKKSYNLLFSSNNPNQRTRVPWVHKTRRESPKYSLFTPGLAA